MSEAEDGPADVRVTTLPAEDPWRRFEVELPAASILAAREARLLEIARNLARASPPNAVSDKVRRRFAGGVMSEILDWSIQEQVRGVVAGLAEHAVGAVAVEDVTFDEVLGLRFRLRCEVRTKVLSPPTTVPTPPTEAETDAALARLALQHGSWVTLPPGTPARMGDRLECTIEAWVEEEAAEPDAPSVLPPVSPVMAQAGEPGSLPPGWWQVVPEGIDWRVTGTGRDCGEPYLELHYRGKAPAQTQITLRFASAGAVRATGRLWLEAPLRLAAGSLPETCSALLVLGRHGPNGAYLDTLTVGMKQPGTMPMVAQRPAAGFDGGAAGGSVVPGIAFWFTEAVPIDLRLRVGLPWLGAAGTLRLAWPEECRDRGVLELGGRGVPQEMSEALVGIRAGEQREVKVVLPPWRDGADAAKVFAVTARRVGRRRAAQLGDQREASRLA